MYRSKAEKSFADYLAKNGLKFENNVKALRGTPDIVFPNEKLCVFFNGCYWHSHLCKQVFFSKEILNRKKTELSVIRTKDLYDYAFLREHGHLVHVIWECEFKSDPRACLASINRRLSLARMRQPRETFFRQVC